MNDFDAFLRLTLAAFFVVSGGAKVRAGRRGLEQAVGEYSWIPARARLPLGAALVVAELGVGVSILTPAARLAAVLMIGLLALFIVVVAVELKRGARHGCGCLGSSAHGRPIGRSLLVEDSVLLTGALIALVFGGSAIETELARAGQPAALVLAAVGVVGVLLLWAEFDATSVAFEEWRASNAAAVAEVRPERVIGGADA